jgi:excisionase family DNA binding protein
LNLRPSGYEPASGGVHGGPGASNRSESFGSGIEEESKDRSGFVPKREFLVHRWSKETDPRAGGSGTLLTVAEVAERLKVCPETVRRFCIRGEVSYSRIGNSIRILESDLEAFIASARSHRQ